MTDIVDLNMEYYKEKRTNKSYRLGQHYVNRLPKFECRMDIFNCENDNISEKLLYEVFTQEGWDFNNLPVVPLRGE